MIEVVGTYVLFLAVYPVAIAMYAVDTPGRFAGWFVVGLVTLYILLWWRPPIAKLWIALWFMPATIICGAATVSPLPFAVWSLFIPVRCASVASIFVCFALNTAVVFVVAWLWSKSRRIRASHNKPLQPIEREDARSG